MSGISNIVGLGFGSWSSVEYVPTLGFGVGSAATVHQAAIGYDEVSLALLHSESTYASAFFETTSIEHA